MLGMSVTGIAEILETKPSTVGTWIMDNMNIVSFTPFTHINQKFLLCDMILVKLL